MLGESRRHGRCARPSQLGGATAVHRARLGQGLAQTGMGQDEIVIHLEQHQLLAQPLFALTQRSTAPPDRRDPLTQAQIESLDKRRIDLPATGR